MLPTFVALPVCQRLLQIRAWSGDSTCVARHCRCQAPVWLLSSSMVAAELDLVSCKLPKSSCHFTSCRQHVHGRISTRE